MSKAWKPAIQIWPFKDAPEELRSLGGEPEGNEELVIFMPKELCPLIDNGDWLLLMPRVFSFLTDLPERIDLLRYANGGFGDYRLYSLPSGGRVTITEGTLRNRLS